MDSHALGPAVQLNQLELDGPQVSAARLPDFDSIVSLFSQSMYHLLWNALPHLGEGKDCSSPCHYGTVLVLLQ